jgi:hypothetical protein
MEESTGETRAGSGPKVDLGPGAQPGDYQLLITAEDGRGGVSEAVARVAVRPDAPAGKEAAPAVGGGGAAAASVITTAPAIYGSKLAAVPKLPSLTFYQGATLDVDAAASGLFDLSAAGWQDQLAGSACVWTLEGPRAGGAKVYGCGAPARFKLAAPGTFELVLEVTPGGGGKVARASSAITVVAKPLWSDYYTAASPEGFAAGRCGQGYFSGAEFAPLALSCGGVGLPKGWGAEQGLDAAAGPQRQLSFSWRLTPLTPRAAAAHKAPLARSSAGGAAAAFGAAAPGVYRAVVVGAAGGAGGGSTSSVNTVYYLSTLLIVEPTANLTLEIPPTSCAGLPVTLAPTPLALLPGQSAAPAQWDVSWADGVAATGRPVALSGSGGSFTFATQPGKYPATVTVDVADGSVTRQLTGRGTVSAKACFRCTGRNVTIVTAPDACRAAPEEALKLMEQPPAWLASAKVDFAPGSDLSPGTRALAVTARSLSSGVVTRCTVHNVTVADATPPRVAPKKAGGECVGPADGKWACWPLPELVTAEDACSGPERPLQFQASCGAGAGPDACRVLPDGRACVRADAGGGAGGRTLGISVLFRDASGNAMAEPVTVPISIRRDGAPGCARASLDAAP